MDALGFVYVMHPVGTQGLYKIGCTIDLARRMKTMQSKVGCKLEYVRTVYSADCGLMEAQIHRRFVRQQVAKEWFYLKPTDLDEIVSWKGAL